MSNKSTSIFTSLFGNNTGTLEIENLEHITDDKLKETLNNALLNVEAKENAVNEYINIANSIKNEMSSIRNAIKANSKSIMRKIDKQQGKPPETKKDFTRE